MLINVKFINPAIVRNSYYTQYTHQKYSTQQV